MAHFYTYTDPAEIEARFAQPEPNDKKRRSLELDDRKQSLEKEDERKSRRSSSGASSHNEAPAVKATSM